MRLDEIAQLRICDLRQDEDTRRWYFDIDRTGGRSTRTASSIRHVPLHRELKRIGPLKYRDSLLNGGSSLESPLWPEVGAEGERTRSSAWSKWFGRYLRSTCGITDATKVFHSFRHTFKRMTRDAAINEVNVGNGLAINSDAPPLCTLHGHPETAREAAIVLRVGIIEVAPPERPPVRRN
jgi:integrase